MTTLTDALDSIVGDAYIASEKTASITTALLYASGLRHETVSDGDSDNSDMAVVLFSAEILFNSKSHLKSRTDEGVIPKTLDEMWSKVMNDLLFTDISEKTIVMKNFPPSSFAPGEKWQNGFERPTG